jgi:hypothetical protein
MGYVRLDGNAEWPETLQVKQVSEELWNPTASTASK